MSYNILVVDDSDVMRNIIRKILYHSGIEIGEIFEAENGGKALAVLDKNWVDVILTDINMPIMSGCELLKRLKATAIFADIPVIIVSTEGRTKHVEEILKLGATGYITKPFKPEDIRNILTESLGVVANGSAAQESEDCDF